jgi:hypothetical protein
MLQFKMYSSKKLWIENGKYTMPQLVVKNKYALRFQGIKYIQIVYMNQC